MGRQHWTCAAEQGHLGKHVLIKLPRTGAGARRPGGVSQPSQCESLSRPVTQTHRGTPSALVHGRRRGTHANIRNLGGPTSGVSGHAQHLHSAPVIEKHQRGEQVLQRRRGARVCHHEEVTDHDDAQLACAGCAPGLTGHSWVGQIARHRKRQPEQGERSKRRADTHPAGRPRSSCQARRPHASPNIPPTIRRCRHRGARFSIAAHADYTHCRPFWVGAQVRGGSAQDTDRSRLPG